MAKQKTYFVRPGAQPLGTDVKMYDTGNLFVCTQNVTTASAVCGELYVEYEVELLTPIWENLTGTSGVLAAVGTVGQGAAAPFGTAQLAGTGQIQLLSDTAGEQVTTVTGLVVGQEYAVSTFLAGSVMSGFVNTPSAGWTLKSGSATLDANGAATNMAGFFTATATATSAILTFTGNVATTITTAAVVVALIPTTAF
jgi:hypothetical protein